MNSGILTFTGRIVDLAKPRAVTIDIRDIAHALSQINRFTGHTRKPYSVAAHCVIGSYFVDPAYALEFLMHDAHEAYMGDVSSPLKSLIGPRYAVLAEDFDVLLAAMFGLRRDAAAVEEVRRVDALMLACELEVQMKADEHRELGPVGTRIGRKLLAGVHDAEESEQAFLARFGELVAERYVAMCGRSGRG